MAVVVVVVPSCVCQLCSILKESLRLKLFNKKEVRGGRNHQISPYPKLLG